MIESKNQRPPLNELLPHCTTLALLIELIDKLGLTKTVKTHYKTELQMFGIIYADQVYKKGIETLNNKAFDMFFKLLPKIHFNNRESISVNMIIKNIKLCITTNNILYLNYE